MKWLSLHVGGQVIAVHVVRGTHPKLEGCNGIYHPDECAIYIARELDDGAFEDTLFHELDHVVNAVSGVSYMLSEVVAPTKFDSLEERMVRARTPIWHRLLKDLGFKFPKGPYR